MVRLIQIAGWSSIRPSGVAIFIHGLGGHPYETWTNKGSSEGFWPNWLVKDIPGLTAYTFQYPAAATSYQGAAFSIFDRAKTLVAELAVEEQIADVPIVFICHSMGGLIAKQALVDCEERSRSGDKNAKRLLPQIKSIIFLGTPHSGSYPASWFSALSFIFWPSDATQNLTANNSSLRELHERYLSVQKRRKIINLEVQEGRDTFGLRIVPPTHPGFDSSPLPIDKSHIDICKPEDDKSPPYRQVRQLVKDVIGGTSSHSAGSVSVAPRLTTYRDRAFWLPRLFRVAAALVLVAVATVAWSELATKQSAASECFPRKPGTGEFDSEATPRPCLPGRLTFVKWRDESKYPGHTTTKDKTVWPFDRDNRALVVRRVDVKGRIIWSERNLFEVNGYDERWNPYGDNWIEVAPSILSRLFGTHGRQLIFRRGSCPGGESTVKTLEFRSRPVGGVDKMCFQWVLTQCNDGFPVGSAIPASEPICVGPIKDERYD